MVGNLVLKSNFRTYIRRYTSLNENFEYGYLHSNAFPHVRLKLEPFKLHKAARQPTICDIFNDTKLFPTVNHRICISQDILSQIIDVIQADIALQN